MRVYGLTGGTGSGKSEAARRFVELGIPVLDADKIGHALIAPGGPAEQAVIQAFGEGIVSNGAIDRARLGAVVFADRQALERLNAIVHPAIRAEIKNQCRLLAKEGRNVAVVDAALISENGEREPCFAGLILVTCSPETRIKRLVASRGLSPEKARERIASQTPPERKLALADWVVENEGSIELLRARIDSIAEDMRHDEHRPD